jgi:hypothetical protein
VHRVSRGDVKAWKEDSARAKARAKWLARVTVLACNTPHYPFIDSEATRWRSDEAKRKRLGQPAVLKKGRPVVAAEGCNRGHKPCRGAYIAGARSGWKCSICRCTASTLRNLTKLDCGGHKEWEQRKPKLATTPVVHDGHDRVYAGEVVWCSICGAYADSKAKGMARP